MKWGEGKMTYASGNFYEGQWANNKRNGQGTMHWLSSDEKYEGNWEDNFQSGFGAHIWLDGSTDNKLLRNRYVGYWQLGQRHGKGTFYYSNGSKYEGDWKENFKHGSGVFTFEDGTQYDGPFENDRMVNRQVPIKDAQVIAQQQAEIQAKAAKEKAKNDDKKQTKKKTFEAAPKKTATTAPAKDKVDPNATHPGSSQSKFGSRAKKEVEENPFKKLIDISDLMELEQNSEDTLKEVQNILLRHNSELKNWYRVYSRKIEAHKCEESFAMTLRQIWRFLRDTHMVSANSTLAQFNRIYNNGVKNHFTLLGSKDQAKFDKLYGVNASPADKGEAEQVDEAAKKVSNISDDEDEDAAEEEKQSDDQEHNNAEDTHNALKIVLQRQFFEAVARAAFVKYASGSDGGSLQTLSQKLEHVFKNNFTTLANKNKSKTVEEEKAFRQAEKVFDEYSEQLGQVFNYCSSKAGNIQNGRRDVTLQVDELLELLRKANLLESKTTDIQLEEIVNMVEKYYAPETTLKAKLE